jgi:hypothetical protein
MGDATATVGATGPPVSTVWLEAVLEELRQARRLDLGEYRRSTLERRLAARMAQVRLEDPGNYLRRLRSDASECDRLIEAILIKVSSFFRDPLVFEQPGPDQAIQRTPVRGHGGYRSLQTV